MKTKTSPITNAVNRSLVRAFFLIALALGWLALSPQARAVCQEGSLTNQNTVLGDDALLNNTTGFGNTASGFQALFHNTTGSHNIATGSFALYQNTGGSANTAYGADALYGNTTGINNTATGMFALYSNTTSSGIKPMAIGRS